MIIVETERVVLRNWRDEDRDLFREINRDEKVMAFFPFRRSHAECDLLFNRNRDMITGTGLGFYALADRDTDEAMGFCGLTPVDLPGILPEGSVEIGWRLATRFWGKGYVTEAAERLVEHGLTALGLAEIYAFAVQNNDRSIAVMRRLGMEHYGDRDFDHPKVPDTHPHLKRHVLYRTTARTLKIRKKRNDQFTQT
ncbi:GNAT family N-acetyltransferase [Rhizobium sp. 'Codium 1']|uniref:GNAT family N-acetyltransferase n=1 Tax=Rhizobium sp. 'Codium 1' TaxID=2940484 RepID=UPI001E485B20|nr:GNAT family N-acetyltransferase [Rhizobium sp. 'Codium 1']MCC8934652.1 GNAT family N-acetyltransferase [Rhizobium sp. 'Codium 1']